MIWMRTPLGYCTLALCFIICVGCTRSVRSGPNTSAGPPSEAEADSHSGRDGVLQGAVRMSLGSDEDEALALEIFERDGEVSWPAAKRTRWLLAEVSSKPMDANTPLRCELRYEPQSAELQVDAWSEAQKPLPEHHQSAGALCHRSLSFRTGTGLSARPRDAPS